MEWTRKTGSTIALKDTPEMRAFAESQGWTTGEKVKRKRRTKEEMEADKANK